MESAGILSKIAVILLNALAIIAILALSVAIYCLFWGGAAGMPERPLTPPAIAGVGAAALAAILCAAASLRFVRRRARSSQAGRVSRFVLIDPDGEREKEWLAKNAVSLLIGKKTPARDVDIDVGGLPGSEHVSEQHAVLNHAGGYWYIEDLESRIGVGLKKRGDETAYRLRPSTPYSIDVGDMIYISSLKLFVR
jgi:hypothetical protein